MELLDDVRAALAAPDTYTTPQLDALNQRAGREHCNRRPRILHQLQGFLTQHTTSMTATSTTHRFKNDFQGQKAIIEVDGKTKAVTAANLADDDVPLLKQYGYGHLIEKLPEPEKKEAPKAKEKDEDKK